MLSDRGVRNMERLLSCMRANGLSAALEGELDRGLLYEGDARPYIFILRLLVCAMSAKVTEAYYQYHDWFLVTHDDEEFVAMAWKVFLHEYKYRPTLAHTQFAQEGHADAKVGVLIDALQLVERHHNALAAREAEAEDYKKRKRGWLRAAPEDVPPRRRPSVVKVEPDAVAVHCFDENMPNVRYDAAPPQAKSIYKHRSASVQNDEVAPTRKAALFGGRFTADDDVAADDDPLLNRDRKGHPDYQDIILAGAATFRGGTAIPDTSVAVLRGKDGHRITTATNSNIPLSKRFEESHDSAAFSLMQSQADSVEAASASRADVYAAAGYAMDPGDAQADPPSVDVPDIDLPRQTSAATLDDCARSGAGQSVSRATSASARSAREDDAAFSAMRVLFDHSSRSSSPAASCVSPAVAKPLDTSQSGAQVRLKVAALFEDLGASSSPRASRGSRQSSIPQTSELEEMLGVCVDETLCEYDEADADADDIPEDYAPLTGSQELRGDGFGDDVTSTIGGPPSPPGPAAAPARVSPSHDLGSFAAELEDRPRGGALVDTAGLRGEGDDAARYDMIFHPDDAVPVPRRAAGRRPVAAREQVFVPNFTEILEHTITKRLTAVAPPSCAREREEMYELFARHHVAPPERRDGTPGFWLARARIMQKLKKALAVKYSGRRVVYSKEMPKAVLPTDMLPEGCAQGDLLGQTLSGAVLKKLERGDRAGVVSGMQYNENYSENADAAPPLPPQHVFPAAKFTAALEKTLVKRLAKRGAAYGCAAEQDELRALFASHGLPQPADSAPNDGRRSFWGEKARLGEKLKDAIRAKYGAETVFEAEGAPLPRQGSEASAEAPDIGSSAGSASAQTTPKSVGVPPRGTPHTPEEALREEVTQLRDAVAALRAELRKESGEQASAMRDLSAMMVEVLAHLRAQDARTPTPRRARSVRSLRDLLDSKGDDAHLSDSQSWMADSTTSLRGLQPREGRTRPLNRRPPRSSSAPSDTPQGLLKRLEDRKALAAG